MTRRNKLIALICIEALLWLFVSGTRSIPFLPDLFLFRIAFGFTPVAFFQLVSVAVLALALIVGMLSRTWQGAIALNLLASGPALILLSLGFRQSVTLDSALLTLTAPLAALGWIGWLLRFARAELAS